MALEYISVKISDNTIYRWLVSNEKHPTFVPFGNILEYNFPYIGGDFELKVHYLIILIDLIKLPEGIYYRYFFPD